MKAQDVPQDDSFLEGHQKAAYAVDAQGRYVVVASRGYEAERVATTVALEALDREVQRAWKSAKQGEVSPLAYHFAVRQWTLGLAAANLNLLRLRVWWHLKPGGFARLSPALRRRYAQGLNLDEAALGVLPDAPELSMNEPQP